MSSSIPIIQDCVVKNTIWWYQNHSISPGFPVHYQNVGHLSEDHRKIGCGLIASSDCPICCRAHSCMVVHGTRDGVVPIETSQEFMRRLAARRSVSSPPRGVDDVLVKVSGGRHSLDMLLTSTSDLVRAAHVGYGPACN